MDGWELCWATMEEQLVFIIDESSFNRLSVILGYHYVVQTGVYLVVTSLSFYRSALCG